VEISDGAIINPESCVKMVNKSNLQSKTRSLIHITIYIYIYIYTFPCTCHLNLFVGYLNYINVTSFINEICRRFQYKAIAEVRLIRNRTTGSKSVCIQEDLRPTNLIKYSLNFLGPTAHAEFVHKVHAALHDSHAALCTLH
jgi:hypothetical protein